MEFIRPATSEILGQINRNGYAFVPADPDDPHRTASAIRRNANHHGVKIETTLVNVINGFNHSVWVQVKLRGDDDLGVVPEEDDDEL